MEKKISDLTNTNTDTPSPTSPSPDVESTRDWLMQREVAARIGLCHPFVDPLAHKWEIHSSNGGDWKCSRCGIQDKDYYAQGIPDPNANTKGKSGKEENFNRSFEPVDPTSRFKAVNLGFYRTKGDGYVSVPNFAKTSPKFPR